MEGKGMVFRRILDALERVERGQEELRSELKALRDALDGGDRPQEDAKLQEGISNLMAFDGRPRRRESL
jgi:hypothetical protein|uniref:Uncharacterized protein n=1 Tax=Myoviridae sp. ctEtC12 TaxID=2825062 RepID=A0A8S5V376_9CAUD|nr:MAG TPA: hypothetical protein [Myoviridae sp. ctEtC12]